MGDFFSVGDDSEYLTHASSADALDAFFDGMLDSGGVRELPRIIRNHGPVTVFEWARDAVSDHRMTQMAERLAESLHEMFDEEFGSPEESSDPPSSAVLAQLRESVEAYCSQVTVWVCHKVGSRTYSVTELMVMLAESEVADLAAFHGVTAEEMAAPECAPGYAAEVGHG